MHEEIIKYLLSTSDSQLDTSVKPLIEKWDSPPTPIQVLKVLDFCTCSALGSGFVISLLQLLYETICKDNNISHEEVVIKANWREFL